MNNISDLTKIIKQKRKEREGLEIDIKASIVIIEECLSYINLNNLDELKSLKNIMKQTLSSLKEKL